MKKLFCVLLFLMLLCTMGFAAAQNTLILPNPHVYFGVTDPVVSDVYANQDGTITNQWFDLYFDKHPGPILTDYLDLLVNQYGIVRKDHVNPRALLDQPPTKHLVYLYENEWVSSMIGLITWDEADPDHLIRMTFSPTCSLQALDVWDGDFSLYTGAEPIPRVLPSPYVYFGVANQYKPEELSNLSCSIAFDEYPEAIVLDYCNLLVEQYGLMYGSKEASADSSMVTSSGRSLYAHQTELLDQDTLETVVEISWSDANDLFKILQVNFSSDCSPQACEVWEGDVSRYLYNAADWATCEVCRGRGKCPDCGGDGHIIRNVSYDSRVVEDCGSCYGGDCPGDCVGGKVRIHK